MIFSQIRDKNKKLRNETVEKRAHYELNQVYATLEIKEQSNFQIHNLMWMLSLPGNVKMIV